MSRKLKSAECNLANHEIVTVAVYLLGGSTRSIDTEDIAVKANQLAPGRFSWEKYKSQISLDSVRKRLWDAKSEEKVFQYLTGSEREGWMLTKNGVAFVEKNIARIKQLDLSRERIKKSDKQWRERERIRLLSSDAFTKIREGRDNEVSVQDAESFFRLDEYVTGSARERKITRVVNAFHDDTDLGTAVAAIKNLLNGASK